MDVGGWVMVSRGWGWLAMGFLVGPGWLAGWLGWFWGFDFCTTFSIQKMDEMMRKCWKSKLKSLLEAPDLY